MIDDRFSFMIDNRLGFMIDYWFSTMVDKNKQDRVENNEITSNNEHILMIKGEPFIIII
jgi:hypothetical protein